MTTLRSALMIGAAALVCATAAFADETQTASLRVDADQSTVLRLDRPAKTVIVGNPMIADVQLVNDRTLYVLGRMFGNTNIIAIDDNGTEVVNTHVTVGTTEGQQVTLYRGPNGQRTLACAPQCERTLTQGDSEFDPIQQQAEKKGDLSAKSAALAGK